MTKKEFAVLLNTIQAQEREVREAGQAEYCHDEDNCHANFDRIAEQLGLTREQVLWVYTQKHLDGLLAYINGHRSQREDITGRIKDARLYLALLWGMIVDLEPYWKGNTSGEPSEVFTTIAELTDSNDDALVKELGGKPITMRFKFLSDFARFATTPDDTVRPDHLDDSSPIRTACPVCLELTDAEPLFNGTVCSKCQQEEPAYRQSLRPEIHGDPQFLKSPK